jgi:hypothetical protein
MDGCKDCGIAYSFYFGVQYHKADCPARHATDKSKVVWTAQDGWLDEPKGHDCEANPVPYVSDGALGHGWECGICGKFLQAG